MKRKPTMDAFNMCLALLLLPGLSIAQTDLLQVMGCKDCKGFKGNEQQYFANDYY